MRRSTTVFATLATLVSLAGCTAAAPPAPSPASTRGDAHGEVADAQEVPEVPLALLAVDAAGGVGMVDLLDGASTSLGTLGSAPDALHSDGRYAFVTTENGVEVIDSGRWTWDHVDHFHYYRATPRLVGTVTGAGAATVSTGPLSTTGHSGVFFAGSGEAVLLDNRALAAGEIVEAFRIRVGDAGALVAPVGDGALVARGDRLVLHDGDGSATDAEIDCTDPSGTITTRVGVVVGCEDRVVLATGTGPVPRLDAIPYPERAAAERAVSFDGRKGRPTVAGVAGDDGFWLLDTRERQFRLVETPVPLQRVTAVDDAEEHVVALDVDGRVRVYTAGAEFAVTDHLVDDPSRAVLTVDEHRAYLSVPEADAVLEIDFADHARIARTVAIGGDVALFAEVGR